MGSTHFPGNRATVSGFSRSLPAGLVTARPPEGETFLEAQERATSGLRSLLRPEMQRVILVSHGGTLKGLVCHLLGLSPAMREIFVIENTGLTVIRYQSNRSRLLVLNDTAHLEE